MGCFSHVMFGVFVFVYLAFLACSCLCIWLVVMVSRSGTVFTRNSERRFPLDLIFFPVYVRFCSRGVGWRWNSLVERVLLLPPPSQATRAVVLCPKVFYQTTSKQSILIS